MSEYKIISAEYVLAHLMIARFSNKYTRSTPIEKIIRYGLFLNEFSERKGIRLRCSIDEKEIERVIERYPTFFEKDPKEKRDVRITAGKTVGELRTRFTLHLSLEERTLLRNTSSEFTTGKSVSTTVK